ncbi:uncharacterized protein Dwil_GK16623 [Drosophila willistoni]|uniref:Peptidase S1 domain-containing protein n=1 Tax=Drosophila willistoni TaxID=7260 RepID=B4MMT0_DROWI|nr:uncharacterized protein Dwil_GK16623 [Drosophila willistoni]
MKLLLTVFLSLTVAFVHGGKWITTTTPRSNPDDKEPVGIITRGYTAADHEAPYIVFLFLHNEGKNVGGLCGGVIIHSNWILTAGHCVGSDWVDIHYGTNTKWGGYVHKVAKSNVYKRDKYDIALVRTPYNAFNERVNKVALPKRETYTNQWAKACGWGEMDVGQKSDKLQCVQLQIISTEECQKTFRFVLNDTVCVSTPGGKSTCHGDSGGPLVTLNNPVLVGITSWGDARGCMVGSPTAFARVSFHLDWIRQITGITA